jgi:hypothetical protein
MGACTLTGSSTRHVVGINALAARLGRPGGILLSVAPAVARLPRAVSDGMPTL